MKRFVPPATAVLAALVLSACGGGSSPQSPSPSAQTDKERVQALEESGAIPKLERGPTLEGVDANGNGIRDDIDAFIERSYATEPQRQAARQLAANLQKTLVVDKQDRAALMRIESEGGRAVRCVATRFTGEDGSRHGAAVGQELEAVTTNTKARLLAYLAYNKAMDGSVLSAPEGDTCE